MFVCLCKSVTDHQIRAAVDEGVTSFDAMQDKLEVSTVCGSCSCEVKDILEKRLTSSIGARNAANSNRILVEPAFA